MPLKQEQIDFDEEIERLEQEREELADQVAALDGGNPVIKDLASQGSDIDVHLQGLRWARDEAATDDAVAVWDEDVDGVTLGGLTGGEFGHVEDTVNSDTSKRGVDSVGSGATRVYYVAKGTVNAPYLGDEMDYEREVGAVSQLPLPFLKWAEARIDELTTVGEEEGNSFAALVQAKRAGESSDDE